MKRISVYIQAVFYVVAGVNHFVNPEFYLPLIPDYFLFPDTINFLSGFVEIMFGFMLFFDLTRKMGSYLIIFMLGAFIPSHVYFIQIGSCIDSGLCVPEWVGWFRLIVIHPVLMWWAYSLRNVRYAKPSVTST